MCEQSFRLTIEDNNGEQKIFDADCPRTGGRMHDYLMQDLIDFITVRLLPKGGKLIIKERAQ
jgi:hypothetical protein